MKQNTGYVRSTKYYIVSVRRTITMNQNQSGFQIVTFLLTLVLYPINKRATDHTHMPVPGNR